MLPGCPARGLDARGIPSVIRRGLTNGQQESCFRQNQSPQRNTASGRQTDPRPRSVRCDHPADLSRGRLLRGRALRALRRAPGAAASCARRESAGNARPAANPPTESRTRISAGQPGDGHGRHLPLSPAPCPWPRDSLRILPCTLPIALPWRVRAKARTSP